jgi:hypothetical protein
LIAITAGLGMLPVFAEHGDSAADLRDMPVQAGNRDADEGLAGMGQLNAFSAAEGVAFNKLAYVEELVNGVDHVAEGSRRSLIKPEFRGAILSLVTECNNARAVFLRP